MHMHKWAHGVWRASRIHGLIFVCVSVLESSWALQIVLLPHYLPPLRFLEISYTLSWYPTCPWNLFIFSVPQYDYFFSTDLSSSSPFVWFSFLWDLGLSNPGYLHSPEFQFLSFQSRKKAAASFNLLLSVLPQCSFYQIRKCPEGKC